MKYICLGCIEPGKFEGMTEGERNAVFDECFMYWKNGKVATTDGPYAETEEQLGGLTILEARDLNHAIQLVSQLPGFKFWAD
jgi:YCII-related domain